MVPDTPFSGGSVFGEQVNVASAIEAGRNLIEKADPELVVYDLRGQDYLVALTLNTKAASA